MALSYGIALLAHTYGFLAVFAAGVALRRIERQSAGEKPPEDVAAMTKTGATEEIATDPETAPAYMAHAVLDFNEQLERIGEVAVVVLLGGMLSLRYVPFESTLMDLIHLLDHDCKPLCGVDLKTMKRAWTICAWPEDAGNGHYQVQKESRPPVRPRRSILLEATGGREKTL